MGELRKQQNRKDSRTERRERLAIELRANLLKRKALARARRGQDSGHVPETGDHADGHSSEK